MNIYITAASGLTHVTSDDLEQCAAVLDDLSLDSALKDSAQILTNWRPDLSSYQTSNEHHSSSIWATTASENASFLIQYHAHLCDEFAERFKKEHDTWESIGKPLFEEIEYDSTIPILLYSGAKDLAQRINFTWMYPVDRSYRLFFQGKWSTTSKPLTWTNREPPRWIHDKDDWLFLVTRAIYRIGFKVGKQKGLIICPRCGKDMEWEQYDGMAYSFLEFECDTEGCIWHIGMSR